MALTLEQRFDNLIDMIAFYQGDFPKEDNLAKSLKTLHEIMTSSIKHALHPSMKEYLFETYNLCVDFKILNGAPFSECMWAMSNQIKDLHEDMDCIRGCSEEHNHNEEHDLFLALKKKEIFAILDVMAAASMRYVNET
jgi:hypothetical protein